MQMDTSEKHKPDGQSLFEKKVRKEVYEGRGERQVRRKGWQCHEEQEAR